MKKKWFWRKKNYQNDKTSKAENLELKQKKISILIKKLIGAGQLGAHVRTDWSVLIGFSPLLSCLTFDTEN